MNKMKKLVEWLFGVRKKQLDIPVVIGSIVYKNFKMKCCKCGKKHWFSERVIRQTGDIKEFLCPKCGETKYEYCR